MKDLKENIQKNNMKKLVLSAVLGMFCYCTNNAMEDEEEKPQIKIKNIDEVLGTMIIFQIMIIQASEEIKEKKNIYATIKDEKGKVTKKSLLNFFKNNLIVEKELVKKGIEYLEQYFHLKGKNDEYECTKDNLTEIFGEEQEGGEKINGTEENITQYLISIVANEETIHECFKKYYYIKKTGKTKEGKKKKKKDIIEEIMNECCDAKEGDDIHHKFLAKLGKLCEEEEQLEENFQKMFKKQLTEKCKEHIKEHIKNKKKGIIAAIKRRITLDNGITKETLENFIKQKIEPLDEKDKDKIKGEEGGCCSCCDCLENKKNKKVEVEESQYEKEE